MRFRACVGSGIRACAQLVPDDYKVMKTFPSVIDGMNHGAGAMYDVFDLHPEVAAAAACDAVSTLCVPCVYPVSTLCVPCEYPVSTLWVLCGVPREDTAWISMGCDLKATG